MTAEEISHELAQIGYKPLFDVISIIEPDIYKVIEAILLVRNQGFGKVNMEIQNGKIVQIEPTLRILTTSLTRKV